MPKITYIGQDGVTQTCEVAVGDSLMNGAVDNDVAGVRAECGGSCVCGTCQIVLAEGWEDKVPPPAETEEYMVEEENSDGLKRRLACQIEVTEELDGLTVTVPETLY